MKDQRDDGLCVVRGVGAFGLFTEADGILVIPLQPISADWNGDLDSAKAAFKKVTDEIAFENGK